MAGVRKSFLLSLADSYLTVVLQLASAVIISRLLTPAEVGIFAIAAVFSAMASAFRDFGVAEYLIQERELTSQKVRAALALNILVSWAIAAVLYVVAPHAADFYREEGVRQVIWVQALNFLFVPFGAVTLAWFRRELDYVPIVICNALSAIAAFIAAVTLAVRGWGYMSLAWSSFVGILVAVVASAWFRPPTLPVWPSLRGIGQVFHFGRFASAMSLVAQAGKGAPELVIGRFGVAADVGIFSRANGLVELVNRLMMRPVLQVCLPYFASRDRESDSLAPAYLSSVGMLTAVGWPLLGCLAVAAFAAIRIVYGPQWLAAVPLAQTLCLALAIDLVHTLSREALVARGEVRRANTLQIQIVLMQLAGLLAGIPFGLQGAAWGLVAAALAGTACSQWHLHRVLGLSIGDMLAGCRSSAILSASTVFPLAAVAFVSPPGESNYVRWGVLGALASAALWLTGLRLLRHPLWGHLELIVLRRKSAD